MPLVGAPPETTSITFAGSAFSYDASNYSHSTMVLVSAMNDSAFSNMNVPPLTTFYTPSASCANRWMLAGTGQVIGTTFLSTIAVQTISITTLTPPVRYTSGPNGIVTPLPSTYQATSSVAGVATSAANAVITSSAALVDRRMEALSFTVFSMDLNGTATDPSYRSCQRYNGAPTYSPGVCPEGQTIAEITAWHVNASSGGSFTGYHTFWQASCCRRYVHRGSYMNSPLSPD